MNKKRKRIAVISSSDDEVHEAPSRAIESSKQIEVCSKLDESHVTSKDQRPNITNCKKLVENAPGENANPGPKATTTKHIVVSQLICISGEAAIYMNRLKYCIMVRDRVTC